MQIYCFMIKKRTNIIAKRCICTKKDIYCPSCYNAGIRRKLMEVDVNARGIIYPYCKACKKNVKIELKG